MTLKVEFIEIGFLTKFYQMDLDTSIPPIHQTRYQLNVNYATIVKQEIDKLLATCFIQPIEEATWLSPIVIVLKKNGKLKICVDIKKINATKKNIHTRYLLLMKLFILQLNIRFAHF
jgi:hypothetical protein